MSPPELPPAPVACAACGSAWLAGQYACGHCGHAPAGCACRFAELAPEALTLDAALARIGDAVSALTRRPRHSPESAFLTGVRILLALQTFGLILLFWKLPPRTSPAEFAAEAGRIERQIGLLKQATRGNVQLAGRLQPVTDQLQSLRREFARTQRIRNLCVGVGLAAWLLIIILHRARAP